MERLARARVVVFGLGGVGSYAVEGLVRSGVGHLTLVDFDDVCVTNPTGSCTPPCAQWASRRRS